MLFQLFSYTITFAYYALSGETVQCTKIISTTELYYSISERKHNLPEKVVVDDQEFATRRTL